MRTAQASCHTLHACTQAHASVRLCHLIQSPLDFPPIYVRSWFTSQVYIESDEQRAEIVKKDIQAGSVRGDGDLWAGLCYRSGMGWEGAAQGQCVGPLENKQRLLWSDGYHN